MNTTIEAKKEATQNPIHLTGRVAWEGNCLKIVDEKALRRIQRERISPSTSQSLESGACATKWAVSYLLPRDEAPLDPAPLGTDAHKLLEDLYSLAPSQRTEANFFDLLDILTDTKKDAGELDSAGLTQWRNKVLSMAGQISAMEDPQQVIVYSNEISLKEMMPGGKTAPEGIPFNGQADRVDVLVDDELGKLVRLVLPPERAETYFGTVFDVETADGEMLKHLAEDLYDVLPHDDKELTELVRELGVELNLVIIDYKTGKSKYWKKHYEQIQIYALALQERTGIMPKLGRVYYTTEGQYHDVPITAENTGKVLDKLGASWKRHNRFIKQEEFPTKATALCGWCPLVNACPRAQEESKSARKAGLPASVDLGIPTFAEHLETLKTQEFIAPESTGQAASETKEEPASTLEVPTRIGEPWSEPGIPSGVPGRHVVVARIPEPTSQEQPEPSEVVGANSNEVIAEPNSSADSTEQQGPTEPKIFVRRAHIEDMNTQTQPNKVAKAYKEAPQYSTFIPATNGSAPTDVNPSSYAMIAGFSLTTMAMKVLVRQDEQITRQRVASLSGTFAHIVNVAHDQWIPGQARANEGEKMGLHSHARLRGALIAVVEEFPFPLHGDLEEMNMWVAKTINRVLFTVQSAEDLVKYGSGKNPWELLVATKQED
ncbi:PD-(D/E)XK nuclease family protein [Glutamicibacter ardleyensis]|uniref:PD-(D/E)XK nuclease family protein n=1 Tax=Glutamicibacter ardleyensis TaxID=225894 RepID=UPI003FCF88B3